MLSPRRRRVSCRNRLSAAIDAIEHHFLGSANTRTASDRDERFLVGPPWGGVFCCPLSGPRPPFINTTACREVYALPNSLLEFGFGQAPNAVWASAGAAEGDTELNAFDNALLAARVGNLNLIRVSSVLPQDATVLEEPIQITPGSLVPTVYSV